MSSSAASSRLSGKTILITGASSGIGRSCALEFARIASPNPLKLILTARREEPLQDLKSQIEKDIGKHISVLPVKLDVSDPSQVHSLLDKLPSEFKDVDVLVNNAGLVKGVAHAGDINPDDTNEMFATNVTGLINMTQLVLPGMKSRDRGDIINIGSVAGREGYPGGSIYCATKAAVRTFGDAMRRELVNTRIRVFEIEPGQVETNFSVVRFYGDKEKADKVYEGVEPLTPDDVAEVVVFNATRRENVVVAETLLFPNHQAAATVMHRKTKS